jgi:hypothetical protein
MKSIKRSLDVNNIMNPGKVFDLNWYEKNTSNKKID